jgi:hypothetical protein
MGLRKAGETVTCDSTLQQNLRAVESLEERLVRRAKICRRSKSSFIDLPRGIRELRQSRSLISKTCMLSCLERGSFLNPTKRRQWQYLLHSFQGILLFVPAKLSSSAKTLTCRRLKRDLT